MTDFTKLSPEDLARVTTSDGRTNTAATTRRERNETRG